jgi:hypothetical protein
MNGLMDVLTGKGGARIVREETEDIHRFAEHLLNNVIFMPEKSSLEVQGGYVPSHSDGRKSNYLVTVQLPNSTTEGVRIPRGISATYKQRVSVDYDPRAENEGREVLKNILEDLKSRVDKSGKGLYTSQIEGNSLTVDSFLKTLEQSQAVKRR